MEMEQDQKEGEDRERVKEWAAREWEEVGAGGEWVAPDRVPAPVEDASARRVALSLPIRSAFPVPRPSARNAGQQWPGHSNKA